MTGPMFLRKKDETMSVIEKVKETIQDIVENTVASKEMQGFTATELIELQNKLRKVVYRSLGNVLSQRDDIFAIRFAVDIDDTMLSEYRQHSILMTNQRLELQQFDPVAEDWIKLRDIKGEDDYEPR
ncbi:MAG: hypothetical protein K0R00_83 [Herbinix sp.]|nr:hypothetical protein [Herbinix sp.]